MPAILGVPGKVNQIFQPAVKSYGQPTPAPRAAPGPAPQQNASPSDYESGGGGDQGGDYGGGGDMPDSGIYAAEQAAAQAAYDKAVAALKAKKLGIYNTYGFNADGSVNGKNSTGLYQVMRHQQAQDLQTAEDLAISRHLGSTGLGAQIEEFPRFQQEADTAQFLSGYKDQLGAVDQAMADAQNSLQNADVQALMDELNYAMQNQDFAPYDTSPSTGSYDDSNDPFGIYRFADRIATTPVPDFFHPLANATASQLTAARKLPGGDLYKQSASKSAARPSSRPVVKKSGVQVASRGAVKATVSKAAKSVSRPSASKPSSSSRPAPSRPAPRPAPKPASRPAAKKPAPKPAPRGMGHK